MMRVSVLQQTVLKVTKMYSGGQKARKEFHIVTEDGTVCSQSFETHSAIYTYTYTKVCALEEELAIH